VELGESFFYRYRAEVPKGNEASILRLAKVLPCISFSPLPKI